MLIFKYAYIRIFVYVYMLIYGYAYVRLYATVYDGIRWYTMVCNGMQRYATNVYNGMQRYTELVTIRDLTLAQK